MRKVGEAKSLCHEEVAMQARLSYASVDTEARNALLDLEKYLEKTGLEESLRDLCSTRQPHK